MKLIKFSIVVFALVFSTSSFALEEEGDHYGMQPGDWNFSLGAGKSILFDDEFDAVAPYVLPFNIDYAITSRIEVGIDFTPTIFTDKANVNFQTEEEKDLNYGELLGFGASMKYGLYNDYGVLAYVSGGGKYGILDKNQYEDGVFNEIDGSGFSINLGGGVRYQLGNDEGDVYPWFFDMAIFYGINQYNISSFKQQGEVMPKTHSKWQDLQYNSLDVVLRFGYRFRTKK